jgi:ABC-type bacteriocin/lantibiotic exporter with double-glycine peptidase domain
MTSYSLKKAIKAIPYFFRYVFQRFPLAYVSVLTIIFGVVAEYAVLSLMIPLSGTGGLQGESSTRIVELWKVIANYVGLPDDSGTWLWLFFLIFGIRMLIGLIQIILNTAVGKQIHSQLSSSTFSHVVSEVPMHEIYKRSVGYYMSLAGDDSIRVGQLLFSLVQTAAALLSAVIGLVVLYLYSSNVFIFTIIFLIICAVILGSLVGRVLTLSLESALFSREAATTFVEALNGLRSIRSMAGEAYVSERYRTAVYRYAKVLLMIDVFNHSSRTLPGLILLMGALFFLFPGSGYLGDVSIVYFFAVTTMLVRILSFLGVAVYSGARAAADIRAVFDLEKIIVKPNESSLEILKKNALNSVGSVSMANLSCGYVAGQPVLTVISAQLKAGRSYALVGKSGSGKSTLSDVLLGFLPPMSGELQIGKQSYEQLDLASLRRKVVLVEQQTRIFSGSVWENIAFGLTLTNAEVQVAVRAAGLSEFISSLPDGVETRLDYQGANLSGGQRQRIGLARAIVRRPDVLILDEATSALDGQTRDMILHQLNELFHNKILLFITHDSHVINSVDEVWHIKNGHLTIERETISA